jgi:membrane-associated phospholipid phosphatase
MLLLGVLIAALRILSGQHYPSDVAAAILLAAVLALVGHRI